VSPMLPRQTMLQSREASAQDVEANSTSPDAWA
jgi:hypothetical protein